MRRVLSGLLITIAAAIAAAPAAAADRCPRSAGLHPGPSPLGLYDTVAPFEHFDAARTQVFPWTCTTAQLAHRRRVRIAARRLAGDFTTPYIAATRGRDELFVYGYGADAATQGGYVAKVDLATGREWWRTRILDPTPAGQWSYPGVMLVHGNGFVYAIYGNVLVKVDPADGHVVARRALPEDPAQTGAAYNGMIVLPDGRIAAKKIERGPCAVATTIGGLACSAANALPSVIVVVDPGDLRVLSQVTTPEPSTGRISAAPLNGREYVYVAGRDHVFRYAYAHGRLALDRRWGPVTYRTGAQTPGTAAGVMGGWVVIQTNFLPSAAPLTVTAVSVRDSRRVLRIRPFAALHAPQSWIVSKAALDAANHTVVTHDTATRRMAALRLDPRRGFRVRWTRRLQLFAFSALVGPPRQRQIVIPDYRPDGDAVTWLDERTGRQAARSAPLSPQPAPGNIVTPGFDGRFFYLAPLGALWSLRPVAD